MPILIRLSQGRRQKDAVRAEWRESAPKDLAAWLDEYCNAARNRCNLLLRCPHGVYLSSDPEPDFDDEGEIVGWVSLDCTVCRPWWTFRKPARVVWMPGVGRVGITNSGPGRCSKFPRRGYRRIDLNGYLFHEDLYVPPDHYVSPYDNRFRMRTHETAGGYICAGYGDDGIGIQARLGWGVDMLRFHGHRAIPDFDEANPIKEEEDDENLLTFYTATQRESPQERKVRIESWKPRFVVVPAIISSHPALGTWTKESDTFADERSIVAAREIVTCHEPLLLYRRTGSWNWTDIGPELPDAPTYKDFYSEDFASPGERQRVFTALAAGKVIRGSVQPPPKKPVRIGCLYSEPVADFVERMQRRWRTKHWKTRAKYVHPPARKPWPENWRNERPMQDLAARLKMLRYGDGLLQASKMCQTAKENRYAARRKLNEKHGINCRQRWPEQETHPSAREPRLEFGRQVAFFRR